MDNESEDDHTQGDIFRDTLANSCLMTLLLQPPLTEQVHNYTLHTLPTLHRLHNEQANIAYYTTLATVTHTAHSPTLRVRTLHNEQVHIAQAQRTLHK